MPRDQENTSDSKSIWWQLKLRLHFTGWLQYFPSLVTCLATTLFTTITSAIGYRQSILFRTFAVLNVVCITNLIVEIITIKYAIRPPERKPSTNKSQLSIFKIMRLRRSCRSFQTQKLSTTDLNAIKQLVKRQTLSSSRLGDRAIRFEYLCASLTVWPAVNVQQYLVAIAPAQYSRQSVIDVGRCLQKIVLGATRLDIATCWIGPGASHDSVIQKLGTSKFDEDKDQIICVCAIGYHSIFEPLNTRVMYYRNSIDIIAKRFARLPLTQLIYHDDGRSIVPMTEDMLSVEPFSRFYACFEGCRWSPSSFNAQPTRCVVVTEENRIQRIDFYASTHSRYYAAVALGIWLANFEMGCNEIGIDGYFKRVNVKQMKDDNHDELIKYDMSWIVRDE